jgi:hypothetical protein
MACQLGFLDFGQEGSGSEGSDRMSQTCLMSEMELMVVTTFYRRTLLVAFVQACSRDLGK